MKCAWVRMEGGWGKGSPQGPSWVSGPPTATRCGSQIGPYGPLGWCEWAQRSLSCPTPTVVCVCASALLWGGGSLKLHLVLMRVSGPRGEEAQLASELQCFCVTPTLSHSRTPLSPWKSLPLFFLTLHPMTPLSPSVPVSLLAPVCLTSATPHPPRTACGLYPCAPRPLHPPPSSLGQRPAYLVPGFLHR